MFLPHGVNVYLAEEIKKHVKVPVATIGALNDPAQMEEIIASGKADIVEMARALLADPELPKKVMQNKDENIVRCLRCFVCMAERAVTSTRRCTVNPIIGREIDGLEIQPARIKKKVLIVGGGPGGLQAAYTAARRGHQVILCDKNSELGGILVGEKAIPFKYEMYQYAVTLEKLCREEGVDIRLNTNVTKKYAEGIQADAMVIAVGSEPVKPKIEGINGKNVVSVINYHNNMEKVTDEVVILGGGLAGCEMTIHLSRQGKKVRLVEMNDKLSSDANIRQRPLLLQEIQKCEVEVHLNTKAIKITEEGVICQKTDGKEITIPGTSTVLALGQKSRRNVVDELWDASLNVAQIGDCVKVASMTEAIYQGHHAAMDI